MNKKNEFYESLLKGINDAIDGNVKKTRRTIVVLPVKKYTNTQVKAIRLSTRMTQKLFASYLGVSQKTVEAWESGKNTPCGSSSRILNMIEMNNNVVNEYPFITIK